MPISQEEEVEIEPTIEHIVLIPQQIILNNVTFEPIIGKNDSSEISIISEDAPEVEISDDAKIEHEEGQSQNAIDENTNVGSPFIFSKLVLDFSTSCILDIDSPRVLEHPEPLNNVTEVQRKIYELKFKNLKIYANQILFLKNKKPPTTLLQFKISH